MDFTKVDAAAMPYLYVEGSAAMDPSAVSAAMGEAFARVMGFLTEHHITPAGPPIAVYHDYDPETMTFRAGLPVNEVDLAKAAGDIRADMTPAGTALHFTHVGPYAQLSESYDAMMAHVAKEGLTLTAPTWEVYVDDPDETPEADLRTEVFSHLAAQG